MLFIALLVASCKKDKQAVNAAKIPGIWKGTSAMNGSSSPNPFEISLLSGGTLTGTAWQELSGGKLEGTWSLTGTTLSLKFTFTSNVPSNLSKVEASGNIDLNLNKCSGNFTDIWSVPPDLTTYNYNGTFSLQKQ